MTSKYSLMEKIDKIKEYFSEDNIIIKSIDGMERYNTPVNDYVIENRKLITEVLKIEGDDVIRLAIAKDGDCSCKSFPCDKDDIINMRNLFIRVYPLEDYPIE